MAPVKTMFLFRNSKNSKSPAPCRFLWDKGSQLRKISGYIYTIIHQKVCILQVLRTLKLSRHGHIGKIILKSSVLLVAVSLLVDAKINSLLFFPSNMASKMSLQSDMLSFPLISRPITAPIKKKSIQVNFNLIRTKYIFYNLHA